MGEYIPQHRRAPRHFDVTFVNLDIDRWYYGLYLQEKPDITATLRISKSGSWYLSKFYKEHNTYGRRQSGQLSDAGIPFNTGAGERNRLTFFTRTPDQDHRLFINGVELPIDFYSDGLLTQDYRQQNPHVSYGLIGVHNQPFENLCTVSP